MSSRPDIGKLFADVTAAYEDAAGVAVGGQRKGLKHAEALAVYQDLALRLVDLVQLHAEIGDLLNRRKM